MPYEEEIQTLTISIWDALLRLPIERDESALTVGVRTMSASVYITGEWRGAVALSCSEDVAIAAAKVMFGLEDKPASKSDMQDALGELVNVIGGNVKALLPGSCQLSLPSVVDGSDYSVRIPNSRLLTHVPFHSDAGSINVSLHQSNEQPA